MAAKIISQKKFAKLVASTGALSQPPGALTRLSNLLYTQRGSLQIANGSHSIGQLPAPFTNAEWIAAFTAFITGEYPTYPVLATPGANLLSDNLNASAVPVSGSGNAAGVYWFAIVGNGVLANTHTAPYIFNLNTGTTFSGVAFSWNELLPNLATVDVYYLGSGPVFPGSTQGHKIITAASSSPATFTGTLTTGTDAIPQGNVSYPLQLIIGSIIPPSLLVAFVAATNGTFPGQAPQPAQLAPGDPNFAFSNAGSSAQTLTPSTSTGALTETANLGTPSPSGNFVLSGWSSLPVDSSNAVAVSLTGNGNILRQLGTTGYGSTTIQYSVDGGSTWSTFMVEDGPWSGTFVIGIPAGALSDLSNLQIRVIVAANWLTGTGAVVVSAAITSITASVTSAYSFSPYGGILGLVCAIPLCLQFAGKEILILGNGYAPQECYPPDLAGATPTALTNTFQAAYPTWQASVDWLTGSQLSALYGAVNYLFTATQGGVSGSGTTPFTGTPPATGAQIADGSVIWTSNGPIVASVAPRGAAHAVAYAGSLWLANTSPQTTSDGIDGPTCLKMSDSNNPNSWNPVNTAFIGRDDGTQITGLQPFTIAALGISPTGSLCVFKEFQTYQVIGVFGSTTFEIQPAQTNLGCIAARSIQFIPGFGVCRFSHLGFAVFDGINDRLISEDIRPYLFGGVDSEADLTPVDPTFVYLSQSAQTTTPPMYLCAMPLAGGTGALTRLFCYDLVMKAWAVIDLPWPISSLGSISVGEGYPLVLAGKTDGTVQRMQTGDLNWDQGATDQSAVGWGFRSPDVFGEGSSQRIFFEQVTLRGYGSSAMAQSILANLWLDGKQLGALAADVVPQGGSNLFEVRFAIFRSGYRAHIDFSGNGGGASGVIDAADWAVSPKSSLARRIIG